MPNAIRSRSGALVLAVMGVVLLGGCASDHSSHASAPASAPATALDVTTINGQAPPAKMTPLQDVTTMIDTVDANGNRLVITQGTRPPGTRAAIHTHEYGGHTCVMSGEITDFMEGHEPMKFPAGTCYYMPPDILMTATNLGTEDAVLIDTFNLPPGKPTITIREPGFPSGAPLQP